MRSALLLLLVAACSPDVKTYGVVPGGPGVPSTGDDDGSGSGSSTVDANPDLIEGLVCLLADPRNFTSCETTGAGGLTVALPGVLAATTADDGTFAIAIPTGSNLAWTVTGANIMPSTIGFGASAIIPAIATVDFTNLADDNGVVVDPGTGTILGQVSQNGTTATGVIAVSTPAGEYPTFYASATDPVIWSASSTEAFGTFWMAGLAPGSTSIAFTPNGGTVEQIDNVPVVAGGITFLTFGL